MTSKRIRLCGVNDPVSGKWWESEDLLRIGRSERLEVVVNDDSLSRRHAEVAYLATNGWVVRDLGSVNGTFLNGGRVGRLDSKIRLNDDLQCGNVLMRVAVLEEEDHALTPAGNHGQANPDQQFLQTIHALSQTVELHDRQRAGHTQRVTDYALILAEELKLPAADKLYLRLGTPLHDIGKIGVDEGILSKTDALSAEEFEAVKAHALRGAAIMESIPDLAPFVPIVRHHHERWDGSGYPDGLAGERIPLLARIVAVADAFDAMTSRRSYRSVLSLDDAFTELSSKAGSHFDPVCIEAFLQLRPRIEELLQQRDGLGQTMLKLQQLAYHDTLTGLPNRRLFEERLRAAVTHARANSLKTAVLFIDLDDFKRVNDTLGHLCGDRLLQLVGERLKGCVRVSDLVARLQGDEFTVILPGLELEEDAAEVACKIHRSLARPFQLLDTELSVTASIGISLYPADGADLETLTQNADQAMYRVKEHGKDDVQRFSPPAGQLAAVLLSTQLEQALQKQEFRLLFQPQRDLLTGSIQGIEALLHWQHPERGLLGSDQFLSVAEETGLIIPIGAWLLRTVCAQAATWKVQGLPRRISVNLPAHQFRHRSLFNVVTDALRESSLDPSCLVLEVTESTAMRSVPDTLTRLKALKRMGVQLLLDGFGAGTASLNHLKQFPLDLLKIDESFVQGLPDNVGNVAITRALILIAHSLGLRVIAKHVETEKQLRFLQSLACDEAQGILTGVPVSADDVGTLLQQGVNGWKP